MPIKISKRCIEISRTLNCKSTPTLIAIVTKLNKEVNGSNVDPIMYKGLVGSLMYLVVTRLDLIYVFSLISRFMESPKDSH